MEAACHFETSARLRGLKYSWQWRSRNLKSILFIVLTSIDLQKEYTHIIHFNTDLEIQLLWFYTNLHCTNTSSNIGPYKYMSTCKYLYLCTMFNYPVMEEKFLYIYWNLLHTTDLFLEFMTHKILYLNDPVQDFQKKINVPNNSILIVHHLQKHLH
jgi:hypothetical protein